MDGFQNLNQENKLPKKKSKFHGKSDKLVGFLVE